MACSDVGPVAHPAVPVENSVQNSVGAVEIAFPAGERAQADVGEHFSRLVIPLDRQPPGVPEQFPRLRVAAGQDRDPAEPGQPVGGLRPQAEFPGHPQPVGVQPPALLVVADGLAPRAQPFGGLQLAPAVPQLAEQLQAPLAVVADRVEVAPDRSVLSPGAERRRHAPPVPAGLEGGQRPAGQLLAHRQVPEVGGAEAEEPLSLGPPGRVVHVTVRRQGRKGIINRTPGQQRDPAQPRRREGPGRRPGTVPARPGTRQGQRRRQRPPRLGKPPAQEPVPGHRTDQPQRQLRLPLTGRPLQRAMNIRALPIQAIKPPLLIRAAQLAPARSAKAV